MLFEFTNDEPIYRQIADTIEEGIFTGVFPEEMQIPSTTEISAQFNINPATVLKGMNLLVNEQLIEKKRGVGMFVVTGAKTMITEKRQTQFYDTYVQKFIKEAKNLNLSKKEILSLIERGFENE